MSPAAAVEIRHDALPVAESVFRIASVPTVSIMILPVTVVSSRREAAVLAASYG